MSMNHFYDDGFYQSVLVGTMQALRRSGNTPKRKQNKDAVRKPDEP